MARLEEGSIGDPNAKFDAWAIRYRAAIGDPDAIEEVRRWLQESGQLFEKIGDRATRDSVNIFPINPEQPQLF